MSKWIIKAQKIDGTCFFSGQFIVTSGIQNLLDPQEIKDIYFEIQRLVKEQSGLDYLQVYENESKTERLFFIDQQNKEMIESGEFTAEDNHCTLLLALEYRGGRREAVLDSNSRFLNTLFIEGL